MGSSGTLKGLFGLAAVVLVGNATAQTQPAPAPQTPAVELGARREVTLTPQQMVAEAKGYLPVMDRAAASVRKMLADAREKRDVVRVLCLNDKLNQIDLAIRTGNDRMEALNAAAGQNDQDRTKHEFTVVQVLRDRVNTLLTEANQCIGEDSGFIGDSKTIVEIDPNIPETDPSEFPEDPLVSEPPMVTSPTY
jgi:hypothetical protein